MKIIQSNNNNNCYKSSQMKIKAKISIINSMNIKSSKTNYISWKAKY